MAGICMFLELLHTSFVNINYYKMRKMSSKLWDKRKWYILQQELQNKYTSHRKYVLEFKLEGSN